MVHHAAVRVIEGYGDPALLVGGVLEDFLERDQPMFVHRRFDVLKKSIGAKMERFDAYGRFPRGNDVMVSEDEVQS